MVSLAKLRSHSAIVTMHSTSDAVEPHDLRATPDRCPECGTTARPPHNPPALPLRMKPPASPCFFDAALQIEFGDSGRAQFIGVSNHPMLLCLYDAQDVFDLPARDLFMLIASKEQAGPHKYSLLEYLFPEQIVLRR